MYRIVETKITDVHIDDQRMTVGAWMSLFRHLVDVHGPDPLVGLNFNDVEWSLDLHIEPDPVVTPGE